MEFTQDNNNNDNNNDNEKMISETVYEKDSFIKEFWMRFNEEHVTISSALGAPDLTLSSLTATRELISKLQDYVTLVAIDLPKYDLRRSQEELDKFRKKVSCLESTIQPKKKFSFSSRNKNKKSASSATQEKLSVEKEKEVMSIMPTKIKSKEVETEVAKVSAHSSVLTVKSICIEDRSNESLIDITSQVENDNGYQVYLKNCDNVTVSVRTTIGSSRLENLKNCKIYLGPCCTSTYVENCTNCVFFIRCHQLRIHHAHNSDFCVYVNSHPIIEDCTTLRFAPYNAFYPNLPRDLEVAKLTTAKNWDNVVDFRWHRSTASPNWCVASETERLRSIEAPGWSIEHPITTATSQGNVDRAADHSDDEDEL